jgi:hypothetical protein
MSSKVLLHSNNILFMFYLLLEPPPLHPYEQKRLMQCMQNNARLQELGIYALSRELEEASSISHKKNKPSHKNTENFESEYDPSSQDDTDDDDNAKVVLIDSHFYFLMVDKYIFPLY